MRKIKYVDVLKILLALMESVKFSVSMGKILL